MNVVRYFWKGTKTERGAMVVPPLSERRDRGVKSLLTCHVCNLERSKKEKQKKELLIAAVLTTHFVSSWLWCLNFTTCVRLIGDTGDVCVSPWLTSWQYCSTPSLVPTQLLVPDGSGSQRPVWMLTCMLSFPQNIATCGSATANPVPALAASACRKTKRKREMRVNAISHYSAH